MFDHSRVRQKLFAASALLSKRADSGVVLRPSSCGYCPTRLWKDKQDRDAGLPKPPDEPMRTWPALQGQYNESLIVLLLQVAGAEVLLAPSEKELAEIPGGERPDDVFGVPPHIDGAIRWPEEGIEDWAVLEFKDLRSNAAIPIALDGLYGADRGYWFQLAAYGKQNHFALKNYARVSQAWAEVSWTHWQGLSSTLFVSCAKDPSTTKMLLAQRLAVPQYELSFRETGLNPQGKPLKPEQLLMIDTRVQNRARIEELGGGIEFYLELIPHDDEAMVETWREIQNLPALVNGAEPPTPIHDVSLPEGERDPECAFYCPHATWCLEYFHPEQAELLKQLEASIQNLEGAAS